MIYNSNTEKEKGYMLNEHLTKHFETYIWQDRVW